MMRYLLCLSGCVLLIAFPPQPRAARRWRNVIPLQTTRAEIFQLLGRPKHDKPDKGEYFDLDTETVTFRWVHPACPTQNAVEDERSLRPDDLVFQVTTKPKYPILSKNLPFDEPASKPRHFSFDYDVDCLVNTEGNGSACSISNGREGFGYSTAKEFVTAVYYFATDAEAEAWNREHQSCATTENK